MGEVSRAAKPPRARADRAPAAAPSAWARRSMWLVAVAIGATTMAVAARNPAAPVAAAPTTAAPVATTALVTTTAVTTATTVPASSAPTEAPTTEAPTTEAPTTEAPTTAAPTASEAPTTTAAPAPTTTARPAPIEPDVAAVTMSAVPPELLLPTSEATLEERTNPINGRRSLARPTGRAPFGCTVDPEAPTPCLLGTLDALGFDVGGPDDALRARRVRQAVATLQLDAGQRATGRPDERLYRYLGVWPGSETLGADDVRRLGTSAGGRPIIARRYGSGPRVVLVVAQTHGDEEAGLRVALRLASQPALKGVTLWVVPTANPDGLAGDTRYLANGLDPNRRSPEQPEQRAVHDLAVSVTPVLAVYYHQNYGWVGGSGASMDPAARYHAITALGPLYRSGDCALGFLWCSIDDAVGSSSILVELPDVVTPAEVQLHAKALAEVATS